jgi:hypothetical protein
VNLRLFVRANVERRVIESTDGRIVSSLFVVVAVAAARNQERVCLTEPEVERRDRVSRDRCRVARIVLRVSSYFRRRATSERHLSEE